MSDEYAPGGRRRHKDDETASPALPVGGAAPTRTKEGFEIIEGIITPRSQFEHWGTLFQIIRDAYVDEGGSVNKKQDPLRDPTEFFKLVSRVHAKDARVAKLVSVQELGKLAKLLHAELFEMGAVGEYLKIPGLEEILLNGYERMFVKIRGTKHRVESPFASDAAALNFLQNMFAGLGDKPLNEEHPLQSGTLPDESRIQAIIAPVSKIGPTFSIRKHSGSVITLQQYIDWNTFTEEFWDDVKLWVKMGLNILISGGTSTGKTSLLRVLLNEIPDEERILLIEETPEIDLRHRSDILPLTPVGLSSRTGEGRVDYRDIVHASLRMNPDRIVFGETRGAETWELLDALNTGHGGSMATVHAESPTRALKRMSTLAGMAFGAGADEQQRAIWDSIASSMNIVIQIKRAKVGDKEHRFVTEAWQFGELEMFDVADPRVKAMIDQLTKAGLVRTVKQGQLIGWPLWQRKPGRFDGALVRTSEVIPIMGAEAADA